jgi:hypothetical protein
MYIKYVVFLIFLIFCASCKTPQKLTKKDLIINEYNHLKCLNFSHFENWRIIPRQHSNNYAYFFIYTYQHHDSSRFEYFTNCIIDSLNGRIIENSKFDSKAFTFRKVNLKDSIYVLDTIFSKPDYNYFCEYFNVTTKKQVQDSLLNFFNIFRELNVLGLRTSELEKNIFWFELTEHIELIYFANDFDGIEKYKKDLIQIDEKWYYKIKPK